MPSTPVDTPVLLIWFNRPGHARRVLDRLREIRPTTLFIAVDGPRTGHPTDQENVTRSIALLDRIDWPCTVQRLIRDGNLGCKYGVSSAIDWFFSQVEEGIILEDDCLPDPTFFSFCTELLTRYRANNQVMHINGANLADGQWWTGDSYLFTRICHIWGWATWRRAWQHFDVTMAAYPAAVEQNFLGELVADARSRQFWYQAFEQTYRNQIDTWDYQWAFAIWHRQGLCLLPRHNLITNIGFDDQATHTVGQSPYAALPTRPLRIAAHPDEVVDFSSATDYLFRTLYRPKTRRQVWTERLKRTLSLLTKGR